ncbi:MAG TPA: ACP S-malonyltransferase [Pyrinomonadaceae bacterium]|jgi:[acyl-carrier-protein] S-malonyltransferase|nr:ACP S-malonyltransferase [Pyrinomonadaceae bacterium]
MSFAFIFPGQGSQYAGMGRALSEGYAAARGAFEEADDALGFPLSRLCFEGPAEDLQLTENTQPAILATSVAALRALESEGFAPPDFVAGHSLGEYSALVAAGALSLSDAVRTVRARGRYMQEAVPVGAGAMAAILGADASTVEGACAEAAQGQVCAPANLNSPKQIVIAGDAAAVDRALEILKSRGVRKAVRLNVSAPFHCALMLPARQRLAADLEKIEFKDLRVPLVSNVDAKLVRTGAEARDALVRQVSSPVRWGESVELLVRAEGVKMFVEVGPGKVLAGLLRQIAPEARAVNVEDAEGIGAARAATEESGAASGG